MNVQMWHSAAVQENLATLRARGVRVIDPAAGELACGMVGEGRLAEPTAIADAVVAGLVRARDLAGEIILVTAGGTREPIDAVRFLTNRSSGRMGHALAEAAAARGAEVVLVTTASLDRPLPFETIRVTTAAEMHGRSAFPAAARDGRSDGGCGCGLSRSRSLAAEAEEDREPDA